MLLTKEQRQAGWYYGGYCDGYYLKYHGTVVATWAWVKPTDEEVLTAMSNYIKEKYGEGSKHEGKV